MSRNSVLVLLALLAAFGAWRHFSGDAAAHVDGLPAAARFEVPSGDTVVVYGRDNCGYTRQTLASLRASKVPVTYVDIDYPDASSFFHDRFDGTSLAGERGYALPVVEVAGRASMRPDPEIVARQFRSAR